MAAAPPTRLISQKQLRRFYDLLNQAATAARRFERSFKTRGAWVHTRGSQMTATMMLQFVPPTTPDHYGAGAVGTHNPLLADSAAGAAAPPSMRIMPQTHGAEGSPLLLKHDILAIIRTRLSRFLQDIAALTHDDVTGYKNVMDELLKMRDGLPIRYPGTYHPFVSILQQIHDTVIREVNTHNLTGLQEAYSPACCEGKALSKFFYDCFCCLLTCPVGGIFESCYACTCLSLRQISCKGSGRTAFGYKVQRQGRDWVNIRNSDCPDTGCVGEPHPKDRLSLWEQWTCGAPISNVLLCFALHCRPHDSCCGWQAGIEDAAPTVLPRQDDSFAFANPLHRNNGIPPDVTETAEWR